jgi:hypothetical protein
VDELDVEARVGHGLVRQAVVAQEARHGVVEVGEVPHVEHDALLVDLEVADVDVVDVGLVGHGGDRSGRAGSGGRATPVGDQR